MSLMKLWKTDLENTTDVFSDRLNSWRGLKFLGACAMKTKPGYNARGVSLLLRAFIHAFLASFYKTI